MEARSKLVLTSYEITKHSYEGSLRHTAHLSLGFVTLPLTFALTNSITSCLYTVFSGIPFC